MIFWLALSVLAGFALTVQLGINNQLRESLQNPVLTALVSFLVGSCGIVLYLAFSVLNGTHPLPSQQQILGIVWWKWLGGLLGAAYVVSVVLVVGRLGGATTTGLVIAGQLVSALVLDHFGWLGFPQHPLSALRLIGALLLILGVYLIQRF